MVKNTLRICITVYTQDRRVTDRQTDGETSCHGIVRAMHTRRAVMTDFVYCDNNQCSPASTAELVELFLLHLCNFMTVIWKCNKNLRIVKRFLHAHAKFYFKKNITLDIRHRANLYHKFKMLTLL